MEITSQKQGDHLFIHLAGRLDAGWCEPVQNALSGAVRDGEHRLYLDMSRVDYMSSAGLRVLLSCYKQLHAIKGTFGVIHASPAVRSVLTLAGLASLMTEPAGGAAAAAPKGQISESPRARYEMFSLGDEKMHLEIVGDPQTWTADAAALEGPPAKFGKDTVCLGIGALGVDPADGRTRLGEFLSVAGAAAYQPADGSNRPDFVVSEGDWVPEGHLCLGLRGRGEFSRLIRFEAKKESRTVGLSELAETALTLSRAPVVVLAVVAETAGLVGASLRQSPASAPAAGLFAFPQIRDWLSFTTERAHRDTTTLITGIAAWEGSPYQALLRPLQNELYGHFHAAVFPYRPLQKGQLALDATVSALFDNHNLSAVLHLINDSRDFSGAGESEFLRGALWMAPLPTPPASSPS